MEPLKEHFNHGRLGICLTQQGVRQVGISLDPVRILDCTATLSKSGVRIEKPQIVCGRQVHRRGLISRNPSNDLSDELRGRQWL